VAHGSTTGGRRLITGQTLRNRSHTALMSPAFGQPWLALTKMSASPAGPAVDHSCNDGTSRGELAGCAIICQRLRVLYLYSPRGPNSHQI